MRKVDEFLKYNSCLNKAGNDEPLFILRAQDILAPTLVRGWVKAYKAFPNHNPAKVTEALALANEMEVWQGMHGRKVPD